MWIIHLFFFGFACIVAIYIFAFGMNIIGLIFMGLITGISKIFGAKG